MFLHDNVPDQRYKALVIKHLESLHNPNAHDYVGLLTDAINIVTGTRPLHPVKYLFDEKATCPISLEEINRGDEVIILPCGHLGSRDHMSTWLQGNDTCPVCRQMIAL